MAGQNRIVLSENARAIIPDATVAATADFDQGDLLMYDSSNKVIKRLAAESDGATFLGISPVTVVDGKIQGPYSGLATDSARAAGKIAGPVTGVVALLALKSGDTFSYGALVYADPSTGNYHVQASGTKAIGVYVGPTVTAGSGDYGNVYLTARYPGDIQHA